GPVDRDLHRREAQRRVGAAAPQRGVSERLDGQAGRDPSRRMGGVMAEARGKSTTVAKRMIDGRFVSARVTIKDNGFIELDLVEEYGLVLTDPIRSNSYEAASGRRWVFGRRA